MTQRFTLGLDAGKPPREWDTDEPDLKTNAVCLHCNNGWLSQLETEASPILRPLLLGEPACLTGPEQRVVATWSYKTVLLFQMLRPKSARVIPEHRFRELYESGRPPTDARVWLASPAGNNAMHETSAEINLAGANNLNVSGFFSPLALGRLLALCAGRLSPGPERLTVGSAVDPRITVQIWPASVRPAYWPPETSLRDLRPSALVKLL